ncbi:hypothetical protein HK105_205758 [Polyrhizophydium stewartii]|uniref:Rap-GAP domain-containing protein n=1 Tax=Polyrhizophydium stewartii TaxID=2732419 RepID=A0ABR4N529_9FUNG
MPFRIFLAGFGLLDLSSRGKLTQLQISDSFLKELERLDHQPERDCITVSVYYCKSGNSPIEQIMVPDSVDGCFEEFLWSLGWPVDIKTHAGFKGNLTPNICETAPYYANGILEVVFHCPYLLRVSTSASATIFKRKQSQLDIDAKSQPPASPMTPNTAALGVALGGAFGASISASPKMQVLMLIHQGSQRSNISVSRQTLQTSANNEGTAQHPGSRPRLHTVGSADNIFHKGGSSHFSESQEAEDSAGQLLSEDFHLKARARTRSHTVGLTPKSVHSQFMAVCQQVSQSDIVHIVWIEDYDNIPTLMKTLSHSAMVFIFVNPLPLTEGLFWIRITVATGVTDEVLNFGPLADGMIVSRHTLGMLCRSTALSAYRFCRYSKNVYKRP